MERAEMFDVLDELMQTLEDGVHGFGTAIDKLDPVVSKREIVVLRRLLQQRREFSFELINFGSDVQYELRDKRSIVATLHRSWMGLKDAASTSDAAGVLDVAAQGEAHALSVFSEVSEQILAPELKVIVERQRDAIAASGAEIRKLQTIT
jgi:uncharacterized protein (TIGR02284 family)